MINEMELADYGYHGMGTADERKRGASNRKQKQGLEKTMRENNKNEEVTFY